MNWFYSSTTKTLADLNTLIRDVILAPDFSKTDLHGFDANYEAKRLDSDGIPNLPSFHSDGWKEDFVTLHLPQIGIAFESESVWHRSLLDVIVDAFQDPSALDFHMKGFRQMWIRPDGCSERVYGEAYCSDVFLEMEDEIVPESGCSLETVVAPMMLHSNSTHLASFGTASLWPAYLGLGLMSKYTRTMPTSFANHHVAYFPCLPDNIQDMYLTLFDKPASSELLTFLKRELMQKIWALLLDSEFMEAYEHGIVIACTDGISRRVYPRFFTYSADYPEKTLLASIKSLGRCLCPRCLITKDKVSELGMKRDMTRREAQAREDGTSRQFSIEMVRKWIYEKGFPVSGAQVEKVLNPTSLTPNRNSFSEALLPYDFNFYQMFVPDLMHEGESGGWKALFTHLIRICYAVGPGTIQMLNRRFRAVPTFGRSTIRKFSNDVSGQKKLAARDYEDLLQCAIPCFEGLLPEPDDKITMDTLFDFATWHALAKSRMHTDSSLELLQAVTGSLGSQLRKFAANVCPRFKTKETPSEMAARVRRHIGAATKKSFISKSTSQTPARSGATEKTGKTFNLLTYKFHSLGDYPRAIRMFGTTDSYSTQIGEQEHHRVKLFYARTNKRSHVKQIAILERHQRRLRQIHARQSATKKSKRQAPHLDPNEKDPLPQGNPQDRYQMSTSRRYPLDTHAWLAENKGDHAIVDFIPKLKDHILRCLLGDEIGPNDDPTPEQLSYLHITNDRIYRHKVLRINYTTYDVRRDQDSINPRTRSDVIVLANETDLNCTHPYWYARVIGIFHAEARYHDPNGSIEDARPFNIDFLWVCWYGFDTKHRSGFKAKWPHWVGFVDTEDPEAFGFLDPADVIRAIHLVPVYKLGRTSDFMPPSISRRPNEHDEDYERYSVDMWVDRDMTYRYSGLGVGHQRDLENLQAPQLPHDVQMAAGEDDDSKSENGWETDESESESNDTAAVNEPEDKLEDQLDSDLEEEFDAECDEDDNEHGDNRDGVVEALGYAPL
ncbi:hypothetical protein EDD85DRAFT_923411 [Armillaria nabsnona]|nr:hypothetical protein EDD85DRAFT_923411 [Armillaria nabsnona]